MPINTAANRRGEMEREDVDPATFFHYFRLALDHTGQDWR